MSHCKTLSGEDCKIRTTGTACYCWLAPYSLPQMIFSYKTNHCGPYGLTHPGNLWPASREIEKGKLNEAYSTRISIRSYIRSSSNQLFNHDWLVSICKYHSCLQLCCLLICCTETMQQQAQSRSTTTTSTLPGRGGLEAWSQPVFRKVKPALTHEPSHLPFPSPPPPHALGSCKTSSSRSFLCLSVETGQMFFFSGLLLSNLGDSECCKGLQS